MIDPVNINTKHLKLDDDLRKYVMKKIGRLDKYLSRHAKKTASADVKLAEGKGKSNDKYTAEVILYVPKKTLTAKESTLNIYAAIDIVEAKLLNQLRKQKRKPFRQRDRKGVFERLRRRADSSFRNSQN